MVTVHDIYSFLDTFAPLKLQMDFDNSGLLIGDENSTVSSVLISLDITDKVISEACDKGVQLIVSHHPVIFHPLKNLRYAAETKKYYDLLQNGISAICLHTNLDIAEGGVNDTLLKLLQVRCCGVLDPDHCGRIGEYETPWNLPCFLQFCKKQLQAEGIRYYSAGKQVKRLAVMGGAGASAIRDAWSMGCDTYLTSDLKYHDFLLAEELGINLIDADHFYTENPIVYVLKQHLSANFPELVISISEKHEQIIHFA